MRQREWRAVRVVQSSPFNPPRQIQAFLLTSSVLESQGLMGEGQSLLPGNAVEHALVWT